MARPPIQNLDAFPCPANHHLCNAIVQHSQHNTVKALYFNDSNYSYDSLIKTASIIGTFLVATTTSLTGNASLGVLSIAVLLVAALVFLLLQKDPTRN